jgi:hypothetical protein
LQRIGEDEQRKQDVRAVLGLVAGRGLQQLDSALASTPGAKPAIAINSDYVMATIR